MRTPNRTFNTLKRDDSKRTPEARRASIERRAARATQWANRHATGVFVRLHGLADN